METINRSDIAA
jgi:hypothetical protein